MFHPQRISFSSCVSGDSHMAGFLHQRIPLQLSHPHSLSPHTSSSPQRSYFPSISRIGLLVLLSRMVIMGLPLIGISNDVFTTRRASKWSAYTVYTVPFVAKDGTVIVCAVSLPYLPFLNNWLIRISRHKHQDKVLVDYATLDMVNEKWPDHAVLVPPAPDAQMAHKFGSQVQASKSLAMICPLPGEKADHT